MFPEHLDKKNQNGHQNTKYYCKIHSKMLSKETVDKILHSWSDHFGLAPAPTQAGGKYHKQFQWQEG